MYAPECGSASGGNAVERKRNAVTTAARVSCSIFLVRCAIVLMGKRKEFRACCCSDSAPRPTLSPNHRPRKQACEQLRFKLRREKNFECMMWSWEGRGYLRLSHQVCEPFVGENTYTGESGGSFARAREEQSAGPEQLSCSHISSPTPYLLFSGKHHNVTRQFLLVKPMTRYPNPF